MHELPEHDHTGAALTLPECRWRGREREPGWYCCKSPKLRVGPRGVPADLCQRCPFADLLPDEPAVARPLLALCLHLGEPYTGHERELLGLSHARAWRRCGHEAQPLGVAVCQCAGCGPRCPGYVAGPEESE